MISLKHEMCQNSVVYCNNDTISSGHHVNVFAVKKQWSLFCLIPCTFWLQHIRLISVQEGSAWSPQYVDMCTESQFNQLQVDFCNMYILYLLMLKRWYIWDELTGPTSLTLNSIYFEGHECWMVMLQRMQFLITTLHGSGEQVTRFFCFFLRNDNNDFNNMSDSGL